MEVRLSYPYSRSGNFGRAWMTMRALCTVLPWKSGLIPKCLVTRMFSTLLLVSRHGKTNRFDKFFLFKIKRSLRQPQEPRHRSRHLESHFPMAMIRATLAWTTLPRPVKHVAHPAHFHAVCTPLRHNDGNAMVPEMLSKRRDVLRRAGHARPSLPNAPCTRRLAHYTA